MQGKLSLTLAMILLSSPALAVDTSKKIESFEGVMAVDYHNGSGDLKVTKSSGTVAKVTATKVNGGKDCEIIIEKVGPLLKVSTEAKGFFNECEVDFEIEVPETVDLKLETGSGDSTVHGTKGALIFKTGSGDLDFVGEATKVEGHTGSGDVHLSGIIGSGELRTGSGDIYVKYDKAPTTANLEIATGSGDSQVILPSSAKVRGKLKAGSGEISNAFGDSPDSDFVLSMKSGSGDLKVKKF